MKKQPKQNKPQAKQKYRVCFATSSYSFEPEKYTGGMAQAIGRYVRAAAIYQALERHIDCQLDQALLPANVAIEYSVLGLGQGNLVAGAKYISRRKAACAPDSLLQPGELLDFTSPELLAGNSNQSPTPEKAFADYFNFLDKAGQAPDLLIVDGVSTMYALRKLLWQRSGRSLTPETLPLHLQGLDIRQFSPLRNTRIWTIARFEPLGFEPVSGPEYVNCTDRIYYIENWMAGGLHRWGWGLAKETRNPDNMRHPGETHDRKILAPLVLEPEICQEDKKLRPHERRRKARRELLDLARTAMPEGCDPEAGQPLHLVAASRVTGDHEIKTGETFTEARATIEAQALRQPLTIYSTPGLVEPGNLERLADGIDAGIFSAGYNTYHGLRSANHQRGLGAQLSPSDNSVGNLQFVPITQGDREQSFRAHNAVKIWNDRTGKYIDTGNGANYLAEQIVKQALRKFPSPNPVN